MVLPLQRRLQLTSPGHAPALTTTFTAASGGGGGLGPTNGGGVGGEAGSMIWNVSAVGPEPDNSEKVWSKPDHVAPFQPSPHESVIVRVHVVRPTSTPLTHPEKGLPPVSAVPPLHESDQLTSLGYDPPDTVIICDPGGAGNGGGEEGAEGGVT